MPKNRPMRYVGVLYLVITTLIAGVLALSRSAQPVELRWRTFTEDGVAEKNVFIKRDENSLWRVTPDLPLWMLNEPVSRQIFWDKNSLKIEETFLSL
jgi:hypothetical protein